jgi:hypothetical protein
MITSSTPPWRNSDRGGLVLFITSKGTLDKQDGALREYVAGQADLVGAIRLPNDAFKKNANTEVTTDIVILRKRLPGELPQGPAWKQLAVITNSVGESISVNEYFAAHPELMLGEMRLEGRMYGRGEPTLVGNGRPLADQLAEASALFPKDVFRAETRRATPPKLVQSFPAPEHIKPNAFALVNEQVAVRDGDSLRLITGLSGQVAKRIRGLIRVRDAVRRCLRSQLDGTPDEDVVAARQQLGRTYDSFVARLGPISERANVNAFRGDPDLPLLLSLEHYDPATGHATKAAIFRERTIQKKRAVPQVNTPQEALLVTLNERGCVDIDYLASLLHRKPGFCALWASRSCACSRSPSAFAAPRRASNSFLSVAACSRAALPQQKRLPGEVQRFPDLQDPRAEPVHQFAHLGHVVQQPKARLDDFLGHQARMAEADGLEAAFAQDQPVRADPPENPGMELVGAALVMRVEQHQFHVPLVQRLHLLGAAEPDHMLLETPPGFLADALFLDVHRHPIVRPQPIDDARGGHEGVTVGDARHRPRGKNARGLRAERLVAQGRGLEVRSVIQSHWQLSHLCRPPVMSQLAFV